MRVGPEVLPVPSRGRGTECSPFPGVFADHQIEDRRL